MLIMVVGVVSKYAVARVFCAVARWNLLWDGWLLSSYSAYGIKVIWAILALVKKKYT